MNTTLERYEKLKEKVIERKAAFNNLMNYIVTETEWLASPASTSFHLSEEQAAEYVA